jgi:hypothetical protein
MSEPTPTPPAPAVPSAPTITPHVEPHTKASVSDAEAATMAGWIKEDLAKGKITQAQADKAFDDLGTPLDQRLTPADTRSDEQRLIDQHFPVGRPEEFSIRYGRPGEHVEMTKELTAFDQSARTWLSGAEFPRELGNSLIVNIEKVVQQTKAMTPEQLESYALVEYAKLGKIFGEGLEDKLTSAGHMVVALDQKTPGLKNLLKSKGIGDNALVASMLIHQAERYHARRGR